MGEGGIKLPILQRKEMAGMDTEILTYCGKEGKVGGKVNKTLTCCTTVEV